eukprot:1629255-Pyramimonas_sp.AAC.1
MLGCRVGDSKQRASGIHGSRVEQLLQRAVGIQVRLALLALTIGTTPNSVVHRRDAEARDLDLLV